VSGIQLTRSKDDIKGLRIFVTGKNDGPDELLRGAVLSDDRRLSVARLLHHVVLQMTCLRPEDEPSENKKMALLLTITMDDESWGLQSYKREIESIFN
jgi:hypothetical protein